MSLKKITLGLSALLAIAYAVAAVERFNNAK